MVSRGETIGTPWPPLAIRPFKNISPHPQLQKRRVSEFLHNTFVYKLKAVRVADFAVF
jgi:hypothetical protein